MTTYRIVRFYPNKRAEVRKTGLSEREAQEHCHREETRKINQGSVKKTVWFDGYQAED